MQLTHNNFRSHSPNNNITRQELPLKANLTEENEITTGYLLRYKYNGIKPDNNQTDENNTCYTQAVTGAAGTFESQHYRKHCT